MDIHQETLTRLVAAGLLSEADGTLRRTPAWEGGMARALRDLGHRPAADRAAEDPVILALIARFPDAREQEIVAMARLMLLVEAREAGWDALRH